MRKIVFILITLCLLASATPAWAYSTLAEDFLIECRQTEAPFPPEGWSDDNLRSVALEVLEAWDPDSEDSWTIGFCLQALGCVGCEEDIDTILAYEQDLPRTVMRALRYVTHPKSIECFLRWIDAQDIPERELALMGLQNMNYDELAVADTSFAALTEKLLEAREAEPKDRLVAMIDEILNQLPAGNCIEN